ncbi:hypothetical protein P4131_32610 [Pseudomonas aeruginosa]|nr:hypothetical protein [Pseudomonas aeruginosa]
MLSIDDIGVTQALSFFNDFSGYYESTLPSLNPRYRYSVLHAAASATRPRPCGRASGRAVAA